MHAFNQHPRPDIQGLRTARLLGLPTDGPDMNVTRSRLGRQGFLTQPHKATTRNGLNDLSSVALSFRTLSR